MEPTCVRIACVSGLYVLRKKQGVEEGGGPDHLVNRLDNLQHFVVAYLAIAVDVVQLECPVELVLHLAAAGDAQGADELLKVDGSGLVGVEHPEDVVGERRGVAKGEELPVDLLELLLGEHARGAVLDEALVPLLQLLLVKVRRLLQFGQLVCAELGLSGRGSRVSPLIARRSCECGTVFPRMQSAK
jgi:hypothetical protein